MRESNSLSASKPEKVSASKDEAKDNANISTDISPDKPAPNTAGNNDDISPEGLLEVIN